MLKRHSLYFKFQPLFEATAILILKKQTHFAVYNATTIRILSSLKDLTDRGRDFQPLGQKMKCKLFTHKNVLGLLLGFY